MFFCIYGDDHAIYNFCCVVRFIYHSNWCSHVEPSLHRRNKLCLVKVYALLFIRCWVFLHLYSSGVLSCIFPVVFFLWFWYQGNAGLIRWAWKCSSHPLQFFRRFWEALILLYKFYDFTGELEITDSISWVGIGLSWFLFIHDSVLAECMF